MPIRPRVVDLPADLQVGRGAVRQRTCSSATRLASRPGECIRRIPSHKAAVHPDPPAWVRWIVSRSVPHLYRHLVVGLATIVGRIKDLIEDVGWIRCCDPTAGILAAGLRATTSAIAAIAVAPEVTILRDEGEKRGFVRVLARTANLDPSSLDALHGLVLYSVASPTFIGAGIVVPVFASAGLKPDLRVAVLRRPVLVGTVRDGRPIHRHVRQHAVQGGAELGLDPADVLEGGRWLAGVQEAVVLEAALHPGARVPAGRWTVRLLLLECRDPSDGLDCRDSRPGRRHGAFGTLSRLSVLIELAIEPEMRGNPRRAHASRRSRGRRYMSRVNGQALRAEILHRVLGIEIDAVDPFTKFGLERVHDIGIRVIVLREIRIDRRQFLAVREWLPS